MDQKRREQAKKLAQQISWDQIANPDTVCIDTFWRLFESTVMKGIDKNSAQYREMRKAYLCGFTECFKFMSDFAGNLTEDQACAVFSRMAGESNKLVDEFMEGQFNG